MTDKIEKPDSEWQAQLSEEQYLVTRRKGTERPFSGEYHDCKDSGIYHWHAAISIQRQIRFRQRLAQLHAPRGGCKHQD